MKKFRDFKLQHWLIFVLTAHVAFAQTTTAQTSSSLQTQTSTQTTRFRSCVQPACTKATAGAPCSCGLSVPRGLCNPNGAMCDRCKKCIPINPLNNSLLNTQPDTSN